jgi:hypothetical protein
MQFQCQIVMASKCLARILSQSPLDELFPFIVRKLRETSLNWAAGAAIAWDRQFDAFYPLPQEFNDNVSTIARFVKYVATERRWEPQTQARCP